MMKAPEFGNQKEKNFLDKFVDYLGSDENKVFEKSTAVSTSIIAALLAISSIIGQNATNNMLIYRNDLNDQWNFFQAKSIKQNIYESNTFFLTMELNSPGQSEAYKLDLKKNIKEFDERIRRYDGEKVKIKSIAVKQEKLFKQAMKKSDAFDTAQCFYQISIIISALAVVISRPKIWLISLLLGLVGLLYSGYGFILP